jgi:hypothetical protein
MFKKIWISNQNKIKIRNVLLFQRFSLNTPTKLPLPTVSSIQLHWQLAPQLILPKIWFHEYPTIPGGQRPSLWGMDFL